MRPLKQMGCRLVRRGRSSLKLHSCRPGVRGQDMITGKHPGLAFSHLKVCCWNYWQFWWWPGALGAGETAALQQRKGGSQPTNSHSDYPIGIY